MNRKWMGRSYVVSNLNIDHLTKWKYMNTSSQLSKNIFWLGLSDIIVLTIYCDIEIFCY